MPTFYADIPYALYEYEYPEPGHTVFKERTEHAARIVVEARDKIDANAKIARRIQELMGSKSNDDTRAAITIRKNTGEQGGGYSVWIEGIAAVGTGATEDEAIRSLCRLLGDFVYGHAARIRELEGQRP